MTRWTCLRPFGLAATLALAAACGGAVPRPGLPSLPSLAGLGRAPVDARDLLTPAFVARLGRPYLLVIIDDKDQAATFALRAADEPVRTWVNADGFTLAITRAGLVVRTAGLGRDLMTADVAQTTAALQAGQPATVRRVHRLLDGNDEVIATAYACRVTPRGAVTITLPSGTFATRLIVEACTDAQGRGFANSYWMDAATGTLRQSRQWISPEVGSLTLQVLHD